MGCGSDNDREDEIFSEEVNGRIVTLIRVIEPDSWSENRETRQLVLD